MSLYSLVNRGIYGPIAMAGPQYIPRLLVTNEYIT
jgi:hypothetical protein